VALLVTTTDLPRQRYWRFGHIETHELLEASERASLLSTASAPPGGMGLSTSAASLMELKLLAG